MIEDSRCLLPSPSHAAEPHDGSMWARPTQCTWAGCFPGCPSSSEWPMVPFCCLTLIIQFWPLLSLNSQMRLWVYPPLGHLAPDWVLMPHSSLGGSSALLPSELWVGSRGSQTLLSRSFLPCHSYRPSLALHSPPASPAPSKGDLFANSQAIRKQCSLGCWMKTQRLCECPLKSCDYVSVSCVVHWVHHNAL